MTTPTHILRPTAAPNRSVTTGLALSLLLGVGQVLSAWVPDPAPGEEGPPVAVVVVGVALGVLVLATTAVAWRTRARLWFRLTAGLQVLIALLGLPAFFVPGLPTWIVAATAAGTVLAAVTVYLLLKRPRPAL
jgi:hypothetical protein